ncbi:MAG TPA: hypothetical protein DCL29_02970 [Eubacterium sp.]|nr:hypothetical protein [Eubacterium sp.]HAV90593.1 hypothetical protein [Eubacterium sp.]
MLLRKLKKWYLIEIKKKIIERQMWSFPYLLFLLRIDTRFLGWYYVYMGAIIMIAKLVLLWGQMVVFTFLGGI